MQRSTVNGFAKGLGVETARLRLFTDNDYMPVLPIAAALEVLCESFVAALDSPGLAEEFVISVRPNWPHVVHATVHQGLVEVLQELGDCLLLPVGTAQRPFVAYKAAAADNRRSHPPESFPKKAEKLPVLLELLGDAVLRDVDKLPLGAASTGNGAPQKHRNAAVAAEIHGANEQLDGALLEHIVVLAASAPNDDGARRGCSAD